MQKRVRIFTLLCLSFMFMGMVGYSYNVYSMPKTRIKGISSLISPTPFLVPTDTPVKVASLSHNTKETANLLNTLVPTIVQQQTGNAGQSATQIASSDGDSNDANGDQDAPPTVNGEEIDDITPIPTIEVQVIPTEIPSPVPTLIEPVPTQIETILPTLVPTPVLPLTLDL
jgi:hypothetical protein